MSAYTARPRLDAWIRPVCNARSLLSTSLRRPAREQAGDENSSGQYSHGEQIPAVVRSMYRNQSTGVAGKFLFYRRAQRAIRPLAGRWVLQRVIGATGADVPQLPVADFIAHSLHRPAASRARLPDRIGHWHLVFPRYGSLRPPPPRSQDGCGELHGLADAS
jgi:hypothetical protein